jgi:hypothetical protein
VDGRRPSLVEAAAVWSFYGLMLIAVVATYSRVSPGELYNVDETGLLGGFGRALVAVNFPLALVAVPLAVLAGLRLGSRPALGVAVGASLLCWVVALPGVVDQDDLDAKAVNAVPALGVALALGLTLVAVARTGLGPPARSVPGDGVRVVLGAVFLVVGLPWLFAEVGAYIGHVPLLGDVFLSEELRPTPDNPEHRVVHLGQHHGGHGVYLALTALVLSRVLGQVEGRWRMFLSFYLSLMLVYGAALVVEDAWTEQVVAREWAAWKIPSVLEPEPTVAWAVLLLAAVVVCVAAFRRREARPRPW